MLTKIQAYTHKNSENYVVSKYLKYYCPVMNAINILEYSLPLIHFFNCVLKTKCNFFRSACPRGSERLGISLVTPLALSVVG